MPIAATDFCLRTSGAHVGCDLRDLGSPPLHRNLQKPNDRILRSKRNLLALISSFFCPSPNFSLGIWDLLSARSSIGTSEALGSLAVHGTPCPHGLRPMRCKICCGCEHGRLRGQCKECGDGRQQQLLRAPAAALLLQLQGVWWQQLLCEHRRQRSQCKECGRSSFCEHGRPRDYCNCRVRWQQHLRARAAVHHLHEGVQWQCHSQAQAAAWPLRAQAAAQAAAQLVQDHGGGSIFSVEAAEADKSSTGTRGGLYTRQS